MIKISVNSLQIKLQMRILLFYQEWILLKKKMRKQHLK